MGKLFTNKIMTLITSGTASTINFDAQSSAVVSQWVDNSVVSTKPKKWFWRKLFGEKESKKYEIDEFFLLIKNGLQELDYKKALKYKNKVVKELQQAEKIWQTAMIERLNWQLNGFRKEIKVISRWFTQYVFESDIADLESKGIQWRTIYRKSIVSYVGVIPPVVMKNIIKAKKYELFDEIIVLYTRKWERILELDKSKKTTQEKRKKVDPICFGKILETNRLFIIGDWMDDECDFDAKKLQTLVDIKTL